MQRPGEWGESSGRRRGGLVVLLLVALPFGRGKTTQIEGLGRESRHDSIEAAEDGCRCLNQVCSR